MRSIKTRVRRAKRSDCFDSHIMSVTVIMPGLGHGWGCFSGAAGQLGLYFLPKNYTMSGERYQEVVATLLIPFMSIYGITHFLQGRAPCHTSKGLGTTCQTNHSRSLTGLVTVLPGVYISVRKRYLFPPPLLKMIFFPLLATHRFSTSIVAFFP